MVIDGMSDGMSEGMIEGMSDGMMEGMSDGICDGDPVGGSPRIKITIPSTIFLSGLSLPVGAGDIVGILVGKPEGESEGYGVRFHGRTKSSPSPLEEGVGSRLSIDGILVGAPEGESEGSEVRFHGRTKSSASSLEEGAGFGLSTTEECSLRFPFVDLVLRLR
jgi:hypothetical protein